jgi:hypothetical protein
VWIPSPAYLLAMKVAASRVESSDPSDIVLLAKLLKLKSAREILAQTSKHIPESMLPQKAVCLLEELEERGFSSC